MSCLVYTFMNLQITIEKHITSQNFHKKNVYLLILIDYFHFLQKVNPPDYKFISSKTNSF